MSARVLIADAEPTSLSLLKDVCEASGFRATSAQSVRDVERALLGLSFDLILLDIDLLGGANQKSVESLGKSATHPTPIVVIVDQKSDLEPYQSSLNAQAILERPLSPVSVQNSINAVFRQVAKVQGQNEHERTSALIESLSHTGNEVDFRFGLQYEVTRAHRFSRALSLIAVELDSAIGMASSIRLHALGSLRRAIRTVDQLYSLSDHRYMLLLPETKEIDAVAVLERLAERHRFGQLTGDPNHIVRVAIAGFDEGNPESAQKLLSRLNDLREL